MILATREHLALQIASCRRRKSVSTCMCVHMCEDVPLCKILDLAMPGPTFANAQQQLSCNSYRFESSYKFETPQDLMQSAFAFQS